MKAPAPSEGIHAVPRRTAPESSPAAYTVAGGRGATADLLRSQLFRWVGGWVGWGGGRGSGQFLLFRLDRLDREERDLLYSCSEVLSRGFTQKCFNVRASVI